MSPKKPLALRIDPNLLERVDAARGDVSRTRWVERALEKALEGVGSDQPTSRDTTEVPEISAPLPARPASPRASKPAFSAQDAALERQARLNKSKGL